MCFEADDLWQGAFSEDKMIFINSQNIVHLILTY